MSAPLPAMNRGTGRGISPGLFAPALIALLACVPLARPALADPGDLDNSFGAFGDGGGGIANVGTFLYAMAVGPDGEIVLADNSGISMVVKRLLVNGSPDPGFGTGGTATLTNPSFVPHPTAIAVQSDGKIVVAGWFDATPALYMVARLNTNGTLDASFDGDGWVVTDIATGPVATDMADAVVIQPDGRIIVGGRSQVGDDFDFSVVRYLTNGALDPTFNSDGKATIGFGGEDFCYDMALQDDGMLVMAGDNEGEIDTDFAVCRLTASGNLDDTFNFDGKLTFGFGHILDHAQAVAVLPSGWIVVTGDDENAAANRDDGLIGLVSASGFVTTFSRSRNNCSDVVAQPDNKFVVLGLHQISGDDWEVALHRLNVDGSLDPTFGTAGAVFIDLGAQDHGWRLGLLPEGRLLANCRSGTGDRLIRFLPNGTLDTGGTPTAAFDDTNFPRGSQENGQAVAVQPDGKILVVGDVATAAGTETDVALARFLADGTLDKAFGAHGRVGFSFQNFDAGTAVALQPNGKIVVAGYTGSGNGRNFLVARFNPDGSLDPAFAFGGFNVVDFTGGADLASAVAVAPDGKIVVAGTVFNGARDVFGVARLNSDGTPDLAFDVDGKQLIEFGVGLSHTATAMIVQPDRKIVVAGTVNANFGLVRLNENGSLDLGFGLSGLTQTDMGGSDLLYGLALAPGGGLYAAGARNIGGDFDFALAQYKPNGTLATCPPFPCTNWPAGMAFVDWSGGQGVAHGVDVRSDGQIVAAGEVPGGFGWAQLRPNTLAGGPIVGSVGFVGNAVGHAVKFYGQDKIVIAGTQIFSDPNFAVARFQTTINTSVDVTYQPQVSPRMLLLRANAPNPFHGSTEIRYELPASCPVSLRIYDVSGRVVRTLVDGGNELGAHSVTWNGTDDLGHQSSAGIYYVRLRAQDQVLQRAIIELH